MPDSAEIDDGDLRYFDYSGPRVRLLENGGPYRNHHRLSGRPVPIAVEKFLDDNRNRDQFVKQIFPQFFVESLFNHRVFDRVDKQLFQEHSEKSTFDLDNPGDRQRAYRYLNEWIFDQLVAKVLHDFRCFGAIIEALRDDQWYLPLADRWQSALSARIRRSINGYNDNNGPMHRASNGSNGRITTTAPMVRDRCNLINFPEPISNCINREAKSREICEQLELMIRQGKGWLVLYGLTGSGKTVLAENTVRKFKRDHFPDGIFWISIGDLQKDHTWEKSLYSKMELLYASIDYYHHKNWTKPDNLQTIELCIKLHFAKHPRSLLILDDVCSSEAVEHFNFGVPVIVTTCDKDTIPKKFSDLKYVSTQLKDGNMLDLNESLTLLRLCMSTKVDSRYFENNFYLKEIMRSINGLPYYIPLIANYMGHFFEGIGSQYDEKKFEELNPRWRDFYQMISNKRDLSEAFHCVDLLLGKSIQSLEQKSPNLARCFKDFVIFFENVPLTVLETIWNMNTNDVVDVLNQLLAKSLVRSHCPMEGEQSYQNKFYLIHDITRNYLQRNLDKDDIKARHTRLVQAYLQKHCRQQNDFACLPDDKYIYRCLSHHLHSAERFDLFPKIFLDLHFIRNKIRFVGQSDVLSDYRYFKRHFTGHEAKLNHFRRFIASNSNICDPNVDLFQVALCQPNDSIVYQEASRLAAAESQNFYFNWCNKDYFILENPPKRINFKCQSDTRFASLSLDSKYIVSVFGTSLQLWDANTAELLATEQEHQATINHCCFSKDGRFVLTTSEDGSAIVWDSFFTRVVDTTTAVPPRSSISANLIRRRRSNSDCFVIAWKSFFARTTNSELPKSNPSIFADLGGRRPSFGYANSLSVYHRIIPNASKFKVDGTSDMGPAIPLRCGDISPDNRFALIGSNQGSISLWSMFDAKLIFSTPNLDNIKLEVQCCAFSGDSRHFLFLVSNVVYLYTVTVTADYKVSVVFSRKLIHDLVAHNAVFGPILPDSPLTIFTSSGKSIFEWRMRKLSDEEELLEKDDVHCRYQLPANRHVSLCAVSASGRRIAGFETNCNEIFLWNRGSPGNFFFLRSLSTVVALNFSQDEKYLFTLNEKAEITLWKLSENTVITSMVDLKNNFAAVFNRTDRNLNVLTIDTKGFLRLFRGISGVEDKSFKSDLKQRLADMRLPEPLSFPINILSCDISPRGYALFRTNTGQVFFYHYDQSGSPKLLNCRVEDDEENEVLICRFVPDQKGQETDQSVIRFVAVCRTTVHFYSLDLINDHFHRYYRQLVQIDPTDSIASLHFVSDRYVLLCTQDSRLIELDCQNRSIVARKRLKSSITSMHLCLIDTGHTIVVAIADKKLIILQIEITEDGGGQVISNSISKPRPLKLMEIPRCCQVCTSYIVYGCDKGTVCLISTESLHLGSFQRDRFIPMWKQQHSQSSRSVTHLTISPDEEFIVSAADSIKLWRKDGTLMQTFTTYGSADRLFVHFGPLDPTIDDHPAESQHENPSVTIVTVTDAKSLYILQNFTR